MNDSKRACVAMVCGILKKKGRSYSSVYDYKRGRHCLYGVSTASRNNVGVYDYERKGFFQGTVPNFFDYITSSYVQIREEGDGMSGYDFQSGHFFIVTFVDSIVSIYDGESASHFHYSLL